MITGMNHVTLAVKDIKKSFHLLSGYFGAKTPYVDGIKVHIFLWVIFGFALMLMINVFLILAIHIMLFQFRPVILRHESPDYSIRNKIFKDNTSAWRFIYFLIRISISLKSMLVIGKNVLSTKKANPGAWKKI